MIPHPRPALALAAWALCLALSLAPLFHPAARAAESAALLDEVAREVRRTFYDESALPAFAERVARARGPGREPFARGGRARHRRADRKSTRLNPSHPNISYPGLCLEKKKHQDR